MQTQFDVLFEWLGFITYVGSYTIRDWPSWASSFRSLVDYTSRPSVTMNDAHLRRSLLVSYNFLWRVFVVVQVVFLGRFRFIQSQMTCLVFCSASPQQPMEEGTSRNLLCSYNSCWCMLLRFIWVRLPAQYLRLQHSRFTLRLPRPFSISINLSLPI